MEIVGCITIKKKCQPIRLGYDVTLFVNDDVNLFSFPK